jgi:DNA-binding FadR family transcriptional regulator
MHEMSSALNHDRADQSLASIWFCVARQPSPDDPKRRHQDLMKVLSAGNPDLAANAMREHIACGLQHTMEVLEPYLQLRKASGSTFIRRQQKQRHILKSSNH